MAPAARDDATSSAASRSVRGRLRAGRSAMASAKAPPSPKPTTGPNAGCDSTVTMVSTPPGTIRCTTASAMPAPSVADMRS